MLSQCIDLNSVFDFCMYEHICIMWDVDIDVDEHILEVYKV